ARAPRSERALREYTRLPHRVARVGNTGGVQYYNDSKATNPHATLSAVAAFDEIDGQVVLIAGGRNKGLDLSVLRPLAPRLRAVVAIGEAASEMERTFADEVPVTQAASMGVAVAVAARQAQPGDVVLLSPACASFDWYPSYSARGNDFAREVERLGERGVAGRPRPRRRPWAPSGGSGSLRAPLARPPTCCWSPPFVSSTSSAASWSCRHRR